MSASIVHLLSHAARNSQFSLEDDALYPQVVSVRMSRPGRTHLPPLAASLKFPSDTQSNANLSVVQQNTAPLQ